MARLTAKLTVSHFAAAVMYLSQARTFAADAWLTVDRVAIAAALSGFMLAYAFAADTADIVAWAALLAFIWLAVAIIAAVWAAAQHRACRQRYLLGLVAGGRHCHINWVGRKVRWVLNWPDAPALL